MKKLSSIIILLLFSSISIAACPNKILGGYVGYQTKYSGTNTLSNIVNKVFIIHFTLGGTAKILSTAKTSMAEPVGVQIGTGDNKNYLYNKSTCTLKMWSTATGSTEADEYFVVGDSGKTLYGIGQDVGDNETRTVVLTKQ